MCGYNAQIERDKPKVLGSSPRVRVQPFFIFLLFLLRRIIPACAGTTEIYDLIGEVIRDHPRVCGYNAINIFAYGDIWGSSPRVRVQLESQFVSNSTYGIIPACAGTTG